MAILAKRKAPRKTTAFATLSAKPDDYPRRCPPGAPSPGTSGRCYDWVGCNGVRRLAPSCHAALRTRCVACRARPSAGASAGGGVSARMPRDGQLFEALRFQWFPLAPAPHLVASTRVLLVPSCVRDGFANALNCNLTGAARPTQHRNVRHVRPCAQPFCRSARQPQCDEVPAVINFYCEPQ
jgi:hypothetical protein